MKQVTTQAHNLIVLACRLSNHSTSCGCCCCWCCCCASCCCRFLHCRQVVGRQERTLRGNRKQQAYKHFNLGLHAQCCHGHWSLPCTGAVTGHWSLVTDGPSRVERCAKDIRYILHSFACMQIAYFFTSSLPGVLYSTVSREERARKNAKSF